MVCRVTSLWKMIIYLTKLFLPCVSKLSGVEYSYFAFGARGHGFESRHSALVLCSSVGRALTYCIRQFPQFRCVASGVD